MSRKFIFAVILLLSAAVLIMTSCRDDSLQQTHDSENEYTAVDKVQQIEDDAIHNPDNDKSKTSVLPRIGIYAGSGSWDVNVVALQHFLDQYGFEWTLFDEQAIETVDLAEKFEIIWFPGGFSADYKYSITSHANIRSFIENGGSYIGSCAGAYYASDIMCWLGSDYDYPLNLFDGKGIGPLAGLIAWGEIASFSLEEGHPANSGFERSIEMYYFDGPYFEPYNSDTIEVLARYSANQEPAVIAGRFVSGKYLLLGPHPELGGYTPDSPDFSVDGQEGAQWPWLYSMLCWFILW